MGCSCEFDMLFDFRDLVEGHMEKNYQNIPEGGNKTKQNKTKSSQPRKSVLGFYAIQGSDKN